MDRNGYYNCFDDNRLYHRNLLLALWSSIGRTVNDWWAITKLRSEIIQERKEILELPDYLLRDIGIDRVDAVNEGNRSADDLPLERVRGLSARCL